ncbi:MAG: 2'-5' RNA ligase family protein [Candidatus Fermentibacteria bacterium]
MACDICLFLDSETESTIRRAWSILRTRGLSSPLLRSGGKPHLTLAIWEDIEPDSILDDLSDFAKTHRVFPVTFSSIATFGPESGTVFLGPVFTPPLIIVHDQLYRIFREVKDSSAAYYRPGSWLPHCSLTLGLQPEELPEAINVCMDIIHLPIKGWIKEIGLLTFDRESVHSLRSYKLGK